MQLLMEISLNSRANAVIVVGAVVGIVVCIDSVLVMCLEVSDMDAIVAAVAAAVADKMCDKFGVMSGVQQVRFNGQ